MSVQGVTQSKTFLYRAFDKQPSRLTWTSPFLNLEFCVCFLLPTYDFIDKIMYTNSEDPYQTPYNLSMPHEWGVIVMSINAISLK